MSYQLSLDGLEHYFCGVALDVVRHHGLACYYCGKSLEPLQIKFDHKLPKSRGGKFTFNNIVPSCHHCNCQKGTKTTEEYVKWLEFRRRNYFYFSLDLREQIAYADLYEPDIYASGYRIVER